MIIMLALVPPKVCCDRLIPIVPGGNLGVLAEVGFEVTFLAYSEFDTGTQVDDTDGSEAGVTFGA